MSNQNMQQYLLFDEDKTIDSRKNSVINKISASDRPFHDWYRFVLSFPPHLVRYYVDKFQLKPSNIILDPFCGSGTTLVEAKLNDIDSIGIEANPMAYFASSVKVDWSVSPESLLQHALNIVDSAGRVINQYSSDDLYTLPPEAFSLLLKDSISSLPLHKTLLLLQELKNSKGSPFYRYELLALAKAVVYSISNLNFGPEVGVSRIKKQDTPVVESWIKEVKTICRDLQAVKETSASSKVFYGDARKIDDVLHPNSIDAVFTSPPYPNEKDYTRTTRLESVLLGFINNKTELKSLKGNLLRSNTRNVYKNDDDDVWIADNEKIQAIAEAIEKKRVALGKTSGFEKLYSKVTKLYFGGMARHFAALKQYLKPGAHLGYVVGDQASYLQIMIRTGEVLADIAQSLGYEVISIDLFRTRFATATKQQMREEVVVLRWPGNK